MPPTAPIRHFCITVYVRDRASDRFLMVRHRKLQKWLPPGGHVEENEIPDAAAVRECLEETGLDVELVGERPPTSGGLVRPVGVQLNVIQPGQHEHIDLLYLGFPRSGNSPVLNLAESEGIRWVPLAEILAPEFDTCEDVRYWVRRLCTQATGG